MPLFRVEFQCTLYICNGWGLPVLLLALRYSVECWILNLEAPCSIPVWGELSSISRYTYSLLGPICYR